jgi:hypothetical protein
VWSKADIGAGPEVIVESRDPRLKLGATVKPAGADKSDKRLTLDPSLVGTCKIRLDMLVTSFAGSMRRDAIFAGCSDRRWAPGAILRYKRLAEGYP